MDPITLSALIAAGSTAVSAGSSAIGNASQIRAQRKENAPYRQHQERKNALIDELLASVGGQGKYGDLFKTDEAAFKRSFVDPAKSMFNNQIAPQIQQQSIANGMQRSSTLDDQLLRAGVDMDQMLNQHYMQFQNQGKDRIANVLNGVLGAGAPPQSQAPTTAGNIFGNAAAGFADSDAFKGLLTSLFSKPGQQRQGPQNPSTPQIVDQLNPQNSLGQDASRQPRKGFQNPNIA